MRSSTSVVKVVRLEKVMYRYGMRGDITPILSVTSTHPPFISEKYPLLRYNDRLDGVLVSPGDILRIHISPNGDTVINLQILEMCSVGSRQLLYPTMCPVCKTPLLHITPEQPDVYGFHNERRIFGRICLSRSCQAQSRISILKFLHAFRIELSGYFYMIYASLLSGGIIRSFADLITIDKTTIENIESISIPDGRLDTFFQYLHGRTSNIKNPIPFILKGFDVPFLHPDIGVAISSKSTKDEIVKCLLGMKSLSTSTSGYMLGTLDEMDRESTKLSHFFNVADNSKICLTILDWAINKR